MSIDISNNITLTHERENQHLETKELDQATQARDEQVGAEKLILKKLETEGFFGLNDGELQPYRTGMLETDEAIFKTRAEALSTMGPILTGSIHKRLSNLLFVGEGAFARVYKADLELHNGEKKTVALKVLTNSIQFQYANDNSTKRFIREANLSIRGFGIEGMLPTLGIAWVPENESISGLDDSSGCLYMISEYMKYGNLNPLGKTFSEIADEAFIKDDDDDDEEYVLKHREDEPVRSLYDNHDYSDANDSESRSKDSDDSYGYFGDRLGYLDSQENPSDEESGSFNSSEDDLDYFIEDISISRQKKKPNVKVEDLRLISFYDLFHKFKLDTSFIDELTIKSIKEKECKFSDLDGEDLVSKETAEYIIAAYEVILHRSILEAIVPTTYQLHVLHSIGLIHRDIKAGNLLLGEKNGEKRVFISDFGLAKIGTNYENNDLSDEEKEHIRNLEEAEANVYSKLTEKGSVMGTPIHIDPQLLTDKEAQYGIPSDIYAFAVMLFKKITGTNPFIAMDSDKLFNSVKAYANSSKTEEKALHNEWKKRFRCEALADLIIQGMKIKPDSRYVDMQEFGESIKKYLSDFSETAMHDSYYKSYREDS